MRMNSHSGLPTSPVRHTAAVLIALIALGAVPSITFAQADEPSKPATLILESPAADKLPGEPAAPHSPASPRREVKIVRDTEPSAAFEHRLARLERMLEDLVAERKAPGKKAFAFAPDFAFDQKEFGRMQKEIDRATREADIAVRRLHKSHPKINGEIRLEGKLAGPHARVQRKALEAQRKALEKQLQALDRRLESLSEEDSADDNDRDVIIRRQPAENDSNDEDTEK